MTFPPTTAQTQRFFLALAMPLVLVSAGMLGYRLIEGWSLFDSLYMTVITLTTVGFREVHELSPAGQGFTMLLALGGVFTLFYAATNLIGFVVSGQVQEFVENRRVERSLSELKSHLIVCGYGRMGRLVCHEFSSQGMPFVVVDKQADVFEQ
jgi:voltage-gated potassium channel